MGDMWRSVKKIEKKTFRIRFLFYIRIMKYIAHIFMWRITHCASIKLWKGIIYYYYYYYFTTLNTVYCLLGTAGDTCGAPSQLHLPGPSFASENLWSALFLNAISAILKNRLWMSMPSSWIMFSGRAFQKYVNIYIYMKSSFPKFEPHSFGMILFAFWKFKINHPSGSVGDKARHRWRQVANTVTRIAVDVLWWV